MSKPTLDDFEDNFEAAVVSFAEPIIAEIDAATKGMTEIQRTQYFLDSAKQHKANLLAIPNCPEVLIEMADQRIARLDRQIVWLCNGKPNRRAGIKDRRVTPHDPIERDNLYRRNQNDGWRRDCDFYADGVRDRRCQP